MPLAPSLPGASRPAVPAATPEPAPAPAPTVPVSTAPEDSNVVRGSGSFISGYAPPKDGSSDSAADGITLNFVNADVRDVAKAVLGDFLHCNYTIAGNVQGTVTIQTSKPLGQSQIMPAFEQALRLSGMAIVKTGAFYKVMPIADAQHESSVNPVTSGPPKGGVGFAVEVVPLQYVSANDMQKLLEPLLPAQGSLRADPSRNVLFVQGTKSERDAIRADIALFDVDWLSGMSFALYTPKYVDADELSKELKEVLGGQTGPLAEMVRLVTINRLNAVLAITPQARYLDSIQKWIDKFDRPGEGSDERLIVYHVQNGRASDLASVLLRALGGAASQPGGASAVGGSSPGSLAPSASPSGEGIAISGLGKINITADDTNNALVILATPQEYEIIRSALRELDTQPLQVMLEAAIAEVTLTDQLRYGVQYFYQPNAKQQLVLSNSGSPNIAGTLPGFSYSFTGTTIKMILDMLGSVTRVEVLSSPQIMVRNNETANLQVGDQIPIISQQAISTVGGSAPIVNSVQYQQTGVILKVTPRVNQGGMVLLDVSQEVSDVTQTTSSGIDSPTIEQRKINSSVAVKDGETIALGGLITTKKTRSRSGIPILQAIPLLGTIFRSTNNEADRTELMVLITPHVIENPEKALAVTDELRNKLQAVQHLVKKRK